MDFHEIITKRYATKRFTEEQVSEEKIEKLCEYIRLAPASFGLQSFRVKIVTEKKLREELAKASFNQPQIATASHIFVFCADTNISQAIKTYQETMLKEGVPEKNATALIQMIEGFVARLSPQEQLVWIQKQIYIAMTNAINGAKELGLDSCPMEGFIPQEYTRILNLPKNLIPTIVVPVGFADDTPRKKVRLIKKDLFF